MFLKLRRVAMYPHITQCVSKSYNPRANFSSFSRTNFRLGAQKSFWAATISEKTTKAVIVT